MRTDTVAHESRAGDAAVASPGLPDTGTTLSDLLDRWVAERIITPEQAALMGQAVGLRASVRPARAHRGPLVVEALGYLGGAIVVTSSLIIGARYWDELGTAARLVVLGCAALGLVAGGAGVPARMAVAGDRLRSVLWLAATAATAGFLTVLAVDTLALGGRDVVLLVATGTALCAAALWVSSPTIVQQLALMVALALTAGSVVEHAGVPDTVPGLGVWCVGLVWALLGWGGLLKPARVALALGSATAILGAMTTAGSDAGMVLTLVTVLTVVGAAVAMRSLLLLGVGTVGVLGNLPAAATKWFPDSLAAPIALLVVGALLVLAAVQLARHRPAEREARTHRDYSAGRADIALMAACAVVGCVVLVVLAAALLG